MVAECEQKPGDATPSVSPSPKTILLVDDNDNDAVLLRLMFRRSRILNPLQIVPSVQEAICYLKGEGMYSDRSFYPFPTLLFIDLHLKDGSGFDILRWIQAHQAHAPLVMVVLSGSDINAFKQAYALGAHSFLTKPLRFEDFQNMVRHVRGIKLAHTKPGYLLELE